MSHRWTNRPIELLALSCLLSTTGCGGAPTPAADDPTAASSDGPERSGPSATADQMSSMADTGALSKADVQATFERAMPKVNRCVTRGRKQLPFLAGDIEVFLRIDQMGKLETSYFTKSTLGDHQVESCILKAWRAEQWPKPVGGKVGESTQAYGFDRDPDEEAPLSWSAAELAQRMAADAEADAEPGQTEPPPFDELKQKLDQCRTGAGASRLLLTIHLDEDGMARAMGLSSPDEGGRRALSCIETAVQTTSFPSPRSNFAKMTLSIP